MKKAKQENKEVLMREKMQWWGFSELLNFNPKAGGVNEEKNEGEGQIVKCRGVQGNCER